MNVGRYKSYAFSLVELTLAMAVAAISLIAIFGLLTTGEQTNHAAAEQTAASSLLTAIANDLRATPPGTAISLQFGIQIPANPVTARTATTLYLDSTGGASTSFTNASRYRVEVTFLPNTGGRAATLTHLRVTWPAAADPLSPSASGAELFLALDRN